MSNIINFFKKTTNDNQNQQNVGNFDYIPNNVQALNYPNNTERYQKSLIENKNESYIMPRQREYNNNYQTNQYQYNKNDYINNDAQYFAHNQQMINFSSPFVNQKQVINNEPVRANFNNPNQFNTFKQEQFDFYKNQSYCQNDQYDPNKFNNIYYIPNSNYVNHANNLAAPIYENYQVPNNYMQHGYNDFSNKNQFYNPNNIYSYNPEVNYIPTASNNYNPYNNASYTQRMRVADIIPKQIGKEIKSEKLRIFLCFVLGLVGIVINSLMLAIYYKAGNEGIFIGLKRNQVMYPFFSILLLIVSIGFFGVSTTDYGFLYSNVKKFERELVMGKESVPYFITRNYRSLISRGIYLNWIAFNIYIFGAISLGIMYGLQYQYDNNNSEIYFLFWKIGKLKPLNSEIQTNIAVLFITLFIHVLNIISSRKRKNNIISYYGSEIIPQQEIIEIKKRTNKKCIITFFVIMAIILFIVIIPWLIIRKKRGLPLKPWGKVT